MPNRLDFAFDASVEKLDTQPVHTDLPSPCLEAASLSELEVRRFNDVALSLNDTMPTLTADQLAGIARRVLGATSASAQSPFVKSCLQRAAAIREMAADPAWPLAQIPARRIRDLLAYIDSPKRLITASSPPLVGLDVALLVDIAMDTLRDELDEYAEFCRYRRALAADLGIAPVEVALDRAQWEREQDDEVRLEHELRRVQESTYSSGKQEYASSAADQVFHVL